MLKHYRITAPRVDGCVGEGGGEGEGEGEEKGHGECVCVPDPASHCIENSSTQGRIKS